MAAPAPAPAPLPLSVGDQANADSIPIPPKLSDKLLNLDKADRFFVTSYPQKSHGKQWLCSSLQQSGLLELTLSSLPHPKCAFYWVPRAYAYHPDRLFSGKERKPCISFIPSQGLLAEKAKFARILYQYYGSDAWKITPRTFDCPYDTVHSKYTISKTLEECIESQSPNHVWITKPSFATHGNNICLYCGNRLKSFEEFITNKYNYKPTMWDRTIKHLEFYGTDVSHIEVKTIVIQQYIDRPLLFNEKYKFDLRVYALLATTNPCVLFFHHGKMRACGVAYNDVSDLNDEEMKEMLYGKQDLFGHLSNCKVQRSHDQYDHSSSSVGGQSMLIDWNSFIEFMYHVAVRRGQFEKEWFEKYQYDIDNMTLEDMKELVETKCCRLFGQVYSASKHVWDNEAIKYDRPGQFMFHGNDIMIDAKGHFYLLEVNRCPAINIMQGPQPIRDMTKSMVKELAEICLEIRQLKLKNQLVDQDTPLKSVRHWIKCRLDYQKPAVERIQEIIQDLEKLLRSEL
eukprot:516643_1